MWVCHKEEQNDSQVQLVLDRRRLALGDKLDLAVSARDAKGESVPDVKYQVQVEPVTPDPGSNGTANLRARAGLGGSRGLPGHLLLSQDLYRLQLRRAPCWQKAGHRGGCQ